MREGVTLAPVLTEARALLCHVHSDSRAARASSVFHAHFWTTRFRSAAHAAQMTCPRLFHTDAACLFYTTYAQLSHDARMTHPSLFYTSAAWPAPPPDTAGGSLHLLPALMPAISPYCPHQHQHWWSALAT